MGALLSRRSFEQGKESVKPNHRPNYRTADYWVRLNVDEKAGSSQRDVNLVGRRSRGALIKQRSMGSAGASPYRRFGSAAARLDARSTNGSRDMALHRALHVLHRLLQVLHRALQVLRWTLRVLHWTLRVLPRAWHVLHRLQRVLHRGLHGRLFSFSSSSGSAQGRFFQNEDTPWTLRPARRDMSDPSKQKLPNFWTLKLPVDSAAV